MTSHINETYKSNDFSKQIMSEQSFMACEFHNCNFTESTLWNAKFVNCVFKGCNISLVKMDGCRFQDVRFIDCKLVGADFFKCDKPFFSVQFTHSILHYCNFSDLNLKGISFAECKLKECHFTNSGLVGASFKDSDLLGTIFHNSDLSKADFSSAINYDIDPQTNKIKKAKFSLPEAAALLRGFDIHLV